MAEHHPHVFNPDKANTLLDPVRKEKLPPEKILDLFELKSGEVSADLGSGNGFFTIPMAKRTGETIYAIDIEPRMLEGLKQHAEEESVHTIQTIEASMAETTLPDHSVTKVFSAFVMHEVPDLIAVFDEIKRVLTKDGKGLIVDWEAVESDFGPPLHVRIPSVELKEKLETYGFHVELRKINTVVYALVISK